MEAHTTSSQPRTAHSTLLVDTEKMQPGDDAVDKFDDALRETVHSVNDSKVGRCWKSILPCCCEPMVLLNSFGGLID